MRIMYDSITAANIPVTAELVAGYDNHPQYTWSAADWARFPNASCVHLDTNGAGVGNCLDVERGDATPERAPGWVLQRRAAGVDPSVYTSQSQWNAVRSAFGSQGVAEPHYWIANYNTGPVMIAGAVAHQYTDVGPFDLSVVTDYWPGVDMVDPAAFAALQAQVNEITTQLNILIFDSLSAGPGGAPYPTGNGYPTLDNINKLWTAVFDTPIQPGGVDWPTFKALQSQVLSLSQKLTAVAQAITATA